MNTRDLIDEFAAREQALADQRVVAPCVAGARLRVRLAGLLLTLRPEPADREGWGVWRISGRRARWQRQARPREVADYLALLPVIRLIPARRLRGASWLAYPLQETPTRNRPRILHLGGDLAPLEPVLARDDGSACWFEAPDRRLDPVLPTRMRKALAAGTPVRRLWVSGLTREFRNAYALAWTPPRRREPGERLRRALATGGGNLEDFQDRGDHWWVAWTTRKGERQHSLINKDLGVLAAGICLSGEDGQFDLASLVGVVEQAPDWA